MSETQQAMVCLVHIFDKYAGSDDDKSTLSKAEVKALLQNELGDLLGKVDDKVAVDTFFKGFDRDQDGQVDFIEFGTFFLNLAVLCRDVIHSSK